VNSEMKKSKKESCEKNSVSSIEWMDLDDFTSSHPWVQSLATAFILYKRSPNLP
jgi:hypothetical protein